MSFLAPLALLLAAGVAVPLLLHLLKRPTGAQVEFPAARYLLRAEREHSRSLRVRNLLLMLLRVALVLALALAAARPLVRGIMAGHPATAVAIVLDNSLSTTAVAHGATTFSRLRDAARALLLEAGSSDRLWLVTADGQLRNGTRDVLLAALGRVTPLDAGGDLPLAVRRATAAVQGSDLDARMIAIATDGQRTAWRRAAHVSVPAAAWIPADSPAPSRGVTAVDAVPLRWTPRGALTIHVVAPESTGYRVQLGTRTIARGIAQSSSDVVVRAVAPDRGWLGGRVEVAPDDFTGDDARSFAMWAGAPPAVLVDGSAGSFVTTAVATLVADGRATAGTQLRVASPDVLAALPALVVPPADPLHVGQANRGLVRLGIPWRFGALEREATVIRGGVLSGIPVDARYRLVAVSGALRSDTLATAGGAPWAVAGAGWVLLASPLDPSFTQLPVRAAFLPWMAGVLGERLAAPAGESATPLHAEPGAAITLPDGIDGLESADGARRSTLTLPTRAPAERGVWFLMRAGRRVGALVVEPDAAELDLTPLAAADFASRLGERNVQVSRSAAEWRRDAFAAGSRGSAVTPLLILAVLLLGAEALIVRSSRSAA